MQGLIPSIKSIFIKIVLIGTTLLGGSSGLSTFNDPSLIQDTNILNRAVNGTAEQKAPISQGTSTKTTPTTTSTTTTSPVSKIKLLKIDAPKYSAYKQDARSMSGTQNSTSVANGQTSTKSSKIQLTNPVVNIFCREQIDKQIKSYTGSGIIIDDEGHVLTNAHVIAPIYSKLIVPSSQGELNEKTPKTKPVCYMRYGSPAKGDIKVIGVFTHNNYTDGGYNGGTGQNDVIKLKVDNSKYDISSTINADPVYIGQQIRVVSYPADTVYKTGGVTAVSNNLSLQSESANVTGLYRFDGQTVDSTFTNPPNKYTDIIDKLAKILIPTTLNWPDLAQTDASKLAESGSSGGGVFNDKGELIGMVANIVSQNGSQTLRFLTIKYIKDNFLNIQSEFQKF